MSRLLLDEVPLSGTQVPTCLVALGVRGLRDRVSSWDQSWQSRVLRCLVDTSDGCHPGGVPLGVDTISGRLGVPAP